MSRHTIKHEVNNEDRAGWAESALETFMGETGTDREAALADLLCDLMHWADREQACHFDSELYRARMHYEAEVQEEEEEITECSNAPDWCRENVPECTIHNPRVVTDGE